MFLGLVITNCWMILLLTLSQSKKDEWLCRRCCRRCRAQGTSHGTDTVAQDVGTGRDETQGALLTMVLRQRHGAGLAEDGNGGQNAKKLQKNQPLSATLAHFQRVS